MKDNNIVYGGGACELSCSIAASQEADKVRIEPGNSAKSGEA